ncbi:hypothetical protein [Alkalicoccobacillus plakortidis]|uniref:DUF5348 domain-containing protein n=1 Tax=Alkalicoccobacillus plakortidis TaxID=444060 RepID=A0ABT0XI91_9BACI|nr:hypothetical protein [Alkalicoccobacillus plakortidis]MCM2675604.1 hypothetical protein [Alkalicoccobacillus plakortidis]
MAEEKRKRRTDLIGLKGTKEFDLLGSDETKTVNIEVIDAEEYFLSGVELYVKDSMGDSYWTGLHEVELNK